MKRAVWGQFGAAIDMLENAINACPDGLWGDRVENTAFWYIAYHTLFFLDLYCSESDKQFSPPAPFTLAELDERGLLPERVYTKQELLTYLAHGRENCRSVISRMTEEQGNRRCGIEWLDLSVTELFLYNMRHVQHHTAQLNLLISRSEGAAPRWVRKTKRSLEGKE